MTETRRTNRYDSLATFVPADTRRQIVNPEPIAPIMVDAAWTPIPDASQDRTSAQDGAKGFLLLQLPVLGLSALLALCVLLLYVLALFAGGWNPQVAQIDKTLIFFGVMAVTYMRYHRRAVSEHYDHSRAGVERHRIDRAAEVETARIDGEIELRRTALTAQLKMLGVDDDERD